MTVTHLPSRKFESPLYAKLRQDVIRFIYERKKHKFFDLSPKLFEPYPGDMLTEHFLLVAKKDLQATADPDLVIQFGMPEDIIQSAQSHTSIYVSQYETFAKQWPKDVMVLKDQSIYKALELAFRAKSYDE